jgi:hypothetical protein
MRKAGRVGGGLEREGDTVRGRAGVADDLRAPARPRGEDAVIQEQLDRGARDEGRQLFEEFDGLEEEVRCSIAPHCFEFDEDAPVGAEAEAVLCERGLTLPPTRRREFALALLHARLKSLEIGVKRTKGGQAGRSVEDQGVTVDGLLEAYLLARDLCGVHESGEQAALARLSSALRRFVLPVPVANATEPHHIARDGDVFYRFRVAWADVMARPIGAGRQGPLRPHRRVETNGKAVAECLANRLPGTSTDPLTFVAEVALGGIVTHRWFVSHDKQDHTPSRASFNTAPLLPADEQQGVRRFVAGELAMAEPAEYGLGCLAQFRSLDDLRAAHADGRHKFHGVVDHIHGFWKDFDWKQNRFPQSKSDRR